MNREGLMAANKKYQKIKEQLAALLPKQELPKPNNTGRQKHMKQK